MSAPVPPSDCEETNTRFSNSKKPSCGIQSLSVDDQSHEGHDSAWITSVGSMLYMMAGAIPQENSRIESQSEGRIILSTMFEGTSNKQYGGKKSVTAVLYCKPARWRSSVRPAILALPLIWDMSVIFAGPMQFQLTCWIYR